jgi:hypothetical protein
MEKSPGNTAERYNMDQSAFHRMMQRWPREGGPVLASHFATWDGAHYLYLSEVGYSQGVPSCAFYPLWPLLVRWGSVLTGGNHLLAGLLLANGLSVAAWVLFQQLAAARFGAAVANWAVVLLIVFPGALFFQFVYSEPLFLLLVMLLWFGLERQRVGLACGAAALLPLARGVGLFVALPIAWHLLTRAPPRWLARRVPVGVGGAPVPACWGPRHYTLLLAPVAGWAAYLALMWHWTGNPWEGIQAQKHWGVHSITNLVNMPKFLLGLFSPTQWHAFRGSLLDRVLFILLLYTLPVQWRLGKDLLVWSYVLGVLPAMSGIFTSFMRFEATAFPLFIALAAFFLERRNRWPSFAFLSLLVVLHAMLLWRYVNFRWAG